MSYIYDYYEDEYDEYEDYEDYEDYENDYDNFIDAHYEDAYIFARSGTDYGLRRATRGDNTDYTLRRSVSPQKITTTVKSPQTQALDNYKSDSEDSYDEEELAFYLEKCMDIDDDSLRQNAHQNDPEIAFQIGKKYSDIKSMHKAIAWYKIAAAKSHTNAQMAIGDYYKEKNKLNVATEWYTMAYGNGNIEAAYKLGLICKQSKDEQAMKWFLKAHTGGYIKAAYQIGRMYQEGELGVSRDYNNSMDWYLRADQAGDDESPRHIGDMYNRGLGVKSNLPVAVEWYKKAYERGNIDAAQEIGQLYYGDMMKDPHTEKEALKWFYRAAIGNNQEASDRLNDLKNEGYRLSSKSQAAIIVERETEKMKQKYKNEIKALKQETLSKNHQIETLTHELDISKNQK